MVGAWHRARPVAKRCAKAKKNKSGTKILFVTYETTIIMTIRSHLAPGCQHWTTRSVPIEKKVDCGDFWG